MGDCRHLDLLNIVTNPQTIGVYVPVVDDQTHAYGLSTVDWHVWAECKSWWNDSSTTEYDSARGIEAHTTTTVYIAAAGRSDKNNVPLPRRVGIKFSETDRAVYPSLSVENFHDLDGKYVYTVVMV